MPELPEIEVVKRDLEKEIVGRRIKDAEVRPGSKAMKVVKHHGRRKELQDLLEGAKIERVDRRGRKLLFELDNDHTLVIGLGSAGLFVKASSSDEMLPHTHIVLGWTIGGQVRLIDPDLTSEIFVIPTSEVDSLPESKSEAIDPLDSQNPFTWHHFASLLESQAEDMKKLMMDERFIIGLGDLYSDEILFTAAIRYDRKSDDLSSQDVRRLYRSLVETLQESIKARGTTWGPDGFRDFNGDEGTYQNELKVFEREGEPCRRCRSPLAKAKVGSSYTYYCPQCQI